MSTRVMGKCSLAAFEYSDSAAIECPFCMYDLRGQTEPRCPECGYSYALENLLDPQRRVHPTLFEHHPERNCSSFWRTLGQSLRPRQFWRQIRPEQTIRLPRLLGYLGIMYGVLAIIAGTFCISDAVRDTRITEQLRRVVFTRLVRKANLPDVDFASKLKHYGTPQAILDAQFPAETIAQATLAQAKNRAVPIFMTCLWPVLTLGSLLLFQWSMRQARITGRHVLRCVCYTSDTMLWLLLLPELVLHGVIPMQFFPLVFVPPYAFACFRLATAYRSYMQMSHPFAIALVSQLMVVISSYCLLSPYSTFNLLFSLVV